LGPAIKAMRFSSDLEKKQQTIVYELKLKKPSAQEMSSKLVNEIVTLRGVLQVKWI